MREIKFRAWDKENNHMLYSSSDGVLECGVEGQHEDILNIWLDGTIEIANCDRNYFPNGIGTVNDNPKRFILQQYTGLKDKNGKDVYEGDILKPNEHRDKAGNVLNKESYAVIVPTGNSINLEIKYQFKRKDKNSFYWDETFLPIERCNEYEVISNIHENPELLKEQS